MARNKAKSAAAKFIREFRFYEVTVPSLKAIIEKQGYTIIEYNNIYNDENVATVLNRLNLERNIAQSKGFTYVDSNYRLVFIHEDLADSEKLLILAHEEGHIFCEHFASAPIIGKGVVEEHEANEFSHYILSNGFSRHVRSILFFHWKVIAICAVAISLIIVGLILYGHLKDEQSYYGDYYITSTGNKYHEKQCIFVKDKSTVRKMTIDEFESGKYEPCGICLP